MYSQYKVHVLPTRISHGCDRNIERRERKSSLPAFVNVTKCVTFAKFSEKVIFTKAKVIFTKEIFAALCYLCIVE